MRVTQHSPFPFRCQPRRIAVFRVKSPGTVGLPGRLAAEQHNEESHHIDRSNGGARQAAE